MTKVVGIDSGRKPDGPCKWCGAKPACEDFTCPRLRRVASYSDDSWEVWFHKRKNWRPRDEPDDAA